VLSSYGRASGFCIDPIEKKPLNHFYPGSNILSFGTAGCNLGCRFCQNWSISKARQNDQLTDWAAPEAVAEAAKRAGCRSLAFTYNDPIIFAEYAIDCAIAAHERGLKTVAVTAGYITPAARRDFFAHIDAANIDLKAFSQQFYHKLCFANLEPVLDTLRWLKQETDVWIEVTTLLIPGHNDSEAEIGQLCDWFVQNLGPETPLHFTAFHPDFKMIDVPRTPPQTLSRARQQALAAGLRHVYTGNVYDEAGQSTYCASCGQRLIERNWYNLGEWNVTAVGSCQFCGTPLAGHFAATPGTWGSRRQQINIG
jgi:pyruvate formate lyase activating enzyme